MCIITTGSGSYQGWCWYRRLSLAMEADGDGEQQEQPQEDAPETGVQRSQLAGFHTTCFTTMLFVAKEEETRCLKGPRGMVACDTVPKRKRHTPSN